MGEYFRVVNLDRKQYFSGHSLNLSGKFSGLQDRRLSSLLVWVLTKTSHLDRPTFRGAWADDRVIVAGDEGVNETVYREADAFEDVSIASMEEWIDWNVFRAMQYWSEGFVDDDGRYTYSSEEQRRQVASEHERREYPMDRWEARLQCRL